jgi:hypothetical protein
MPEHAGRVLDRLLGLDRAVGDDLGDASSPYFSVTYLMTSPRRRSSKSTSKSGIEDRSGLRKRSKIRPCRSGSRSVIRMA